VKAERRARQGRHFPRDAHDRQRVGAVRRDLDLEDGVVEAEILDEGGPEGGIRGQLENAVFVVADAELSLGAEQTLGDSAPDLGRLDGTSASAVRRPGAAFGAPQITENVLPGTATRQRRMWWPAAVTRRSRSIASISPTTTPESPSTSGDTEATSMPALTRRSAIWAGVRSVSTNSSSQR